MMNRKGNVIEFMNQHFPQIFPVKTSLLKLEKLIRSRDYPVTNISRNYKLSSKYQIRSRIHDSDDICTY